MDANSEDNWLGGRAPMWWSQADVAQAIIREDPTVSHLAGLIRPAGGSMPEPPRG